MDIGYTVVTAINLNQLIESVNRLVFQGWEVAGGVFKEEMVFMQAMVKKKVQQKPATPRRNQLNQSTNKPLSKKS